VLRQADLRGQHVVVSAGGTREYLDPVRFIGNRSSGRQGYALATAAASRGATVTLVAANVTLPDPAGVTVVSVVTTAEMREAVLTAAHDADAVVMAAAPADFRPVTQASSKIKKTHDGSAPRIELVENPDILAELVQTRTSKRPIIVGFAAETGDADGSVMDHARAKLVRKGCDLLVVNDVSEGRVFNATDSEAVIIGADGFSREVPSGPKADIAHAVWDAVVGLTA
jgi:phosphopantothenoylcysteine decarboxylase/phosphopantothenate--cysteine ligase